MRVIFAGLFVFAGIFFAVILLSINKVFEHINGALTGFLLAPVFIVLILVALVLFNLGQKLPTGSVEEQIADLAEKGLLISTHFRAIRAFQVEELEDEGSHYFVELTDGSVIYLSGQYLYDYEPISNDKKNNQPRQFPCSDFTLQTHRDEGYLVQIICGGNVLKPEVVAKAFTAVDCEQDRVPEDGQIITDRTYEELKAQFYESGSV